MSGRHAQGPSRGRTPIPGRPAADGGFTLLEPSQQERDRLGDQVVGAQTFLMKWLDAAYRLGQAYSLAAQYGSNTTLGHEIQQAEALYDAAKADAQFWLGRLPEERA